MMGTDSNIDLPGASEVLEFTSTLPVITNDAVAYHHFFQEYICKNQACLIKNVAHNWDSSVKWVTDGKPNFDYLNKKYGDCLVVQYDCNKQYYNSQETQEISFKEYLKYWQEHPRDKLLYLKDWHLKNQRPFDNFYEVPTYFKSDWLNEYLCQANKDDYRFVYMGPKGTWTPFHCDVFNSYSWSVNICGLKRWVLLIPGEELKLKDPLGNIPFSLNSETYKTLRHYEVIQQPGEAMFVPSGWYHQVWNVNDTISINHNWINGGNINCVYNSLMDHLKRVQNEISDCRDMADFDKQCQLILKSTFGMDCHDFADFILYIFNSRISFDGDDCLGYNEAMFDLKCIKEVLGKVLLNVNSDRERISCALDKMENIF